MADFSIQIFFSFAPLNGGNLRPADTDSLPKPRGINNLFRVGFSALRTAKSATDVTLL